MISESNRLKELGGWVQESVLKQQAANSIKQQYRKKIPALFTISNYLIDLHFSHYKHGPLWR